MKLNEHWATLVGTAALTVLVGNANAADLETSCKSQIDDMVANQLDGIDSAGALLFVLPIPAKPEELTGACSGADIDSYNVHLFQSFWGSVNKIYPELLEKSRENVRRDRLKQDVRCTPDV